MSKKDKFELRFVNRDPSSQPPVKEVPEPTSVPERFPRDIHEVGRMSKFVSLEYIAEVVNDQGEPEEKAQKLLAIFTIVRKTAMHIPEHIDILEYLEGVAQSRDQVTRVLQTAGGKIESLVDLIKQAQQYNQQGTPEGQRDYGANEPYFDSGSIAMARGSDRPKTPEAQKELLDAIKRTLEAYAERL